MPADDMGARDPSREQLTDLHLKIVEHFDDEELRTLCFDVNVDYDNLRGQGKEAKARELIDFMQRQGRLPDLIQACCKTRPRVNWSFGPDATTISKSTATERDKVGFVPLGRWQIQISDGSAWVIDFYPNGVFAGQGIGAWWGAGAQAGGGWSFFIPTQTLQLQGSVNGMYPIMLAVVIQGQQGSTFVGIASDGKSYAFTRIAGA